jgi:hypothetical protein
MKIPVLIEPVPGKGYRAGPLAFTAEGATPEEARNNLRGLIEARLAAGAQLVELEVGPAEHPTAKFAGTWDPDDPFIQEWEQAVEEYRRQMDEDPNVR